MSRLTLSVLFAAILIPALGMAQTQTTPAAPTSAATAGPTKIVWMNLEAALFSCDEGKALVTEITKFVDDKQKEMDIMRNESEKLKNQLNVQGSKLTDEARAELEDQIESRDTIAQRFQQDTQKEIENRKAKLTNYIGKKMQPVIEKLSKEKGLGAVLIFNSQRDAWVDPSLNVTEDVVKAYNEKYGAGATKVPAAPAPAPKKP
jgi:outer membrane protein